MISENNNNRSLGKTIISLSTLFFLLLFAIQVLSEGGITPKIFENWRPFVYLYLGWCILLSYSIVLINRDKGLRILFILPAFLFTIAMVIFPLCFGVYIALHDWNLSSFDGKKFNGIDNVIALFQDPFYWNAITNMIIYVAAILIEYAIAFGLALLLNVQILARKFFRVAFLMPLMLSPVAVSWMIGKSMLENRFGPIARLSRELGWENPAFFSSAAIARTTIMIMDAWMFIPLMMIMLLAGLQALPKDVSEASKVDGATPFQQFLHIIFPLMLPVSITALLIRVIFKLKLADIVINVTSGGPGVATDTVTSLIFREYRDRSNVGYGTMMAVMYLILIIFFMTNLLKAFHKLQEKYT